jgi:hypothetical protein
MLVLCQYHVFESYKINIYSVVKCWVLTDCQVLTVDWLSGADCWLIVKCWLLTDRQVCWLLTDCQVLTVDCQGDSVSLCCCWFLVAGLLAFKMLAVDCLCRLLLNFSVPYSGVDKKISRASETSRQTESYISNAVLLTSEIVLFCKNNRNFCRIQKTSLNIRTFGLDSLAAKRNFEHIENDSSKNKNISVDVNFLRQQYTYAS